ncbi:MAG: hypothetical protein ACYC65_09495 [Candidatus Limnocylindrales bacterium]
MARDQWTVDAARTAREDRPMDEDRPRADGEEPADPLEPIDPREAARVRRRDHDLGAERRDLMRPGMGKVFKQILDRQGLDAEEPPPRRRRQRG